MTVTVTVTAIVNAELAYCKSVLRGDYEDIEPCMHAWDATQEPYIVVRMPIANQGTLAKSSERLAKRHEGLAKRGKRPLMTPSFFFAQPTSP